MSCMTFMLLSEAKGCIALVDPSQYQHSHKEHMPYIQDAHKDHILVLHNWLAWAKHAQTHQASVKQKTAGTEPAHTTFN